MTSFNSISAITVTSWNSGKTDKHGKQPKFLKPLAGTLPSINKCVIAGTIAEKSSFELNKSYMVQVTESESNEYGRNFQFTNLGELSGLALLDVTQKLGTVILLEDSIEAKDSLELAITKEESTKGKIA